MRPEEATMLAGKIGETWRYGPTKDVWREELLELDVGRANTAYVKLRRSETSAPTIALFFATYRALRTEDASTREDCPVCDDTGWVDAAPSMLPDGRPVRGVAPCGSCRRGREMEHTYRRIRAANDRTGVAS
ncbi:MAG: hypothetical protein AAGA42_02425 [Actinomycetota bacterium]